MPEEVFIIVVVAIVFGSLTSIAKSIIHYLQSRHSGAPAGSGSSLTESQLRRMIEESVERANRPLQQRFDDLEEQMSERLLTYERKPRLPGREGMTAVD
ncbi:MAG: hypothetical protein ACOCSK_02615 [Rhodothermales bacterium]